MVESATPAELDAIVDDRTALIRDADGTWRAEGAGEVAIFVDGAAQPLSALP